MDLSINFAKIKETVSEKLRGILQTKKPVGEPPRTVIAIDMRHSAFHYISKIGDEEGERAVYRVRNYAGAIFDEAFYSQLKEALNSFVEDEPSEEIRRVALVVPDEAVALDNIRLPALKTSKLINNALSVKISELYSNSADLKTLRYLAEKNKQYVTFNIASIKNSIINTLCAICSECGMLCEAITFASASAISAAAGVDETLSKGSYLFLDVKDVYSRFAFVKDGCVIGFYSLPFGLEYLSAEAVVPEDMLCDHTRGELAVLNAQEKAKAKKLSVLKELNGEDSKAVMDLESMMNLGAVDDSDEVSEQQDNGGAQKKIKVMQKKSPRKLPPYMQRPIPETAEGVVAENFRVFVKYALMLLRTNPVLVAMGNPSFVSVNLPEKYSFLFDKIAEEEQENGIPFVRFSAEEELARNLEIYGGFLAHLWHEASKF